jgi:uncharacterized protein YndB with AHSA1/START domain
MAVETVAPVLRSITIECSPEHAFNVFTRRIAEWWPLDTYSVYEGEAAGVSFEPGVGGRIVERSNAGEESIWGEVLVWEPGSRLVYTWHPGRSADEPSTEVDLRLVAVGDATRVELEHRGWEALAEPEQSRSGYDEGWGFVLGCYVAAATA